MAITTGVNCYTCHRGNSHPEVKLPPEGVRGPGGPGGPGQGPGGPGGPGKGPGGPGGNNK